MRLAVQPAHDLKTVGAGQVSVSRAPRAASPDPGPTAVMVLETAERLCGERGLESVSIRDIAREAGVSISVIYHHYGSKGNLLRTILQTRLAELGVIRGAIFAELEEQPRPELRKILYAIFAPMVQLRAPGAGREPTVQFLARALVTTLPELKEEGDATVRELKRVVELLERALPDLSHAEICWRLHFTFGIEHMTHWDDARLAIMSGGDCDGGSIDDVIERAIDYAEAAFLAPPRRR
jgi:AcrR family transcriptional regulator